MKVLTIANRKGGAGKSTIAAHLSIEAVRSGLRVVIIDMDPQKSLDTWWQLRDEETPDLTISDSDTFPETLKSLSDVGYDLCIIDTPGDTSNNASCGINAADLIIIPTKPTSTDLSSIGRTIQFINDNEKKYLFVITQCVPNSVAGFQAASVLSDFGPVAPTVILNRTCYYQAMSEGSSGADINVGARKEMEELWKYISTRLGFSEINTIKTKKKMVA